jgi:hypothetical protein
MDYTHQTSTSDAAAQAPPPRTPLATYTFRPAPTTLLLLFGAAVTGLGAFSLVGPPIFEVLDSLAGVLAWLLLFTPLGVGGLALGAWLSRLAARHFGLRVVVYADGLERRQLGRSDFWPWQEIKEVWYNADGTYLQGIRPAAATYTLRRADGQVWKVGWFLRGVELLGQTIEQETAGRLLSDAVRACEAGEAVPFGPIAASAAGLERGPEVLPWAEVASAELVDGGRVLIRSDDGWTIWLNSRMSKIPNLILLFRLIGEMLRRGKGAKPAADEAEGQAGPPPADAVATAPRRTEAPEVDPEAVWELPDQTPLDLLGPLGKPVGVCQASAAGERAAWILLILCGFFVVLMGCGVVGASLTGTEQGRRDGVWACAAGLALAAVPIPLIFLYILRRRNSRLMVFRDGFVEIKGSRMSPCRWDRVERVWQQITRVYVNNAYTGTSHTYTAERDDGRRFVVSNQQYQNIEKFGVHLIQSVHRRLLQRAREGYRAGGTLLFGSLKVGPPGICLAMLWLPWDQYGGCQVHGGQLHLYRAGERGPWNSTPLASVANVYVLLELLREIHTAPVGGL